jgi:hypothetical protein
LRVRSQRHLRSRVTHEFHTHAEARALR